MARTKLVDLYKSLNDKPLNEAMYGTATHDAPKKSSGVETLQVKLGGDEKTELKISNQTDSTGDIDLSNVTLEFKGEKYEGLEFKFEEVLEDHDNEGKDALFVAESDDKMFEVEVNIDANYDQSGIIDDVEWRSLETFPKDDKGEPLDEQGCTEQEIAEGTCGYGENGELGDEPAGPHLFMLEDELEERKNVGKGGKNECEKDSDCSGMYDGLCCDNGKCSQCISFEKPKSSKKLEESVLKRLQKLANIKK